MKKKSCESLLHTWYLSPYSKQKTNNKNNKINKQVVNALLIVKQELTIHF